MSYRALIVAAAVAVSAAGPEALATDPYTEVYRLAVDRQMGTPSARPRRPQDEISLACSAWMLGRKTGQSRYADFALAAYDRFLEAKLEHDFHQSRPFGLLTWELHQGNALTGPRRESARRQAAARIAWFLDQRKFDPRYFDCNIALADTLAVACLARTFGDDPAIRAGEIRRAVAALGRRIVATGDLNENACNYASLGICFFLELARLEGWMDDIRASAHFRTMFARMRDLVSPTGSIPEYGDGYFKHRAPRLDFALLLEMAARLYDDASFQHVAHRCLPPGAEVDDDQLHRGYLLLTLEPVAPGGQTQPPLSAVQTRRVPGEPIRTVPDKLILRSGSRPGDAMILVDLYADGSHAHEFKRSSIGYFEAAGVPLFHNLGRRGTRSGQCGNTFWILPPDEGFPGYPREDAWNTMVVPADYCFAGEEPGVHRIESSLLLRNFRTRDLRFLRLDNLRLEGPRGTLLLDGFESPRSWHGNVAGHPKVKLETSPDCTQGAGSQQVNWSIFGEQYCTRNLEEKAIRNTTFRLADFDTVKLDYRYAGQHPHCNLRGLFERWIDLGDRPLHCQVARAEARQLGGDACGSVEFTSYNGAGNALERRIVLTQEGALVVVDRFTAGPSFDGWEGGQLWQLYALDQRGDDWFASRSDGAYRLPDGGAAQRRMLVKYWTGAGAAVGVQRVRPTTMHAPRADGGKHTEFFTTWCRQRLSAERPTLAAMVVLPLTVEEDAARVAEGIRFAVEGGGEVRVTVAAGAAAAELCVTLAGDAVAVRRGAPDRGPAARPATR